MYFEKGAFSKKKKNKTMTEKANIEPYIRRFSISKQDRRMWAESDMLATMNKLELIKPRRRSALIPRDLYV